MMIRYIALILFSLLLSACGANSNDTTTAPPPTNNTKESFQQKLDSYIQNTNIAGAIAWLKKGDKTWLAAAGVADKSNQLAITIDTQMRIASMTKPMVAVTMLKLSEEGYFSLNDIIAQYLPDDINAGIANTNKITIKQLLSMTSGIKDYTDDNDFNDAVALNPQSTWSAAQVLSYIFNDGANFEPESSWDYSNSNYVLCDIIIANVTASTLAEQMRRILFTPLKMDATYVENQEVSSASGKVLSARGYDGNEDVTDINDGIGFGDGGVVSTVSDLNLFLTAVFNDKSVLNAASLQAMQTFHPSENYGLGLEKRNYNQGMAYAHSGGSSGFSGDMLYFPESGITWVILTNQVATDDNADAFISLSSVLTE